MRGSILETDTKMWVDCLRYLFFAHVDEESIESVVGDEKTREGRFCKIVNPEAVCQREEEREEDEYDSDVYEENDLEKRVKIYDLVP